MYFWSLFFSRPLFECEGAFMSAGDSRSFLTTSSKEVGNGGPGMDVRFAPIRVAAFLGHRKPFGCYRHLPYPSSLDPNHPVFTVNTERLAQDHSLADPLSGKSD